MVKIHSEISRRARLDIKPNSGYSPAKRAQTAREIMDKCYFKFSPMFDKTEGAKKHALNDGLEDVFGIKTPRLAQENEEGLSGSVKPISREVFGRPKQILGYRIDARFEKDEAGNEIIKPEHKMVFFHELRHFVDYLTVPKIIKKAQMSPETDEKTDIYLKVYDEVFYNKLEENSPKDPREFKDWCKSRLGKAFGEAKAKHPEKIEICQNMRHRLKTEQNAYIDGAMYRHEINESENFDEWKQKWSEKYSEILERNTGFSLKIEALEEMLKNELKKARKAFHKKLKNDKIDTVSK